MCFSLSRTAMGVGGLLLLAGCTQPNSPTIPEATAPVASTRTKVSAPESDLGDPLRGSDDAAMLRSAPDYSITPSALMSNTTMGVSSGVGVDSLQPIGPTLPGELPEAREIKVDGQVAPPILELPGPSTLDPY